MAALSFVLRLSLFTWTYLLPPGPAVQVYPPENFLCGPVFAYNYIFVNLVGVSEIVYPIYFIDIFLDIILLAN